MSSDERCDMAFIVYLNQLDAPIILTASPQCDKFTSTMFEVREGQLEAFKTSSALSE